MLEYLYNKHKHTGNDDGFQVAHILNGLRSIHLKMKNNLTFEGYYQNSDHSDTPESFAFTVGSSSIKIFTPTRPTF